MVAVTNQSIQQYARYLLYDFMRVTPGPDAKPHYDSNAHDTSRISIYIPYGLLQQQTQLSKVVPVPIIGTQSTTREYQSC